MKIFNLLIFASLLNSSVMAQKYTPTDAGSKVHFVIKNFGIKTGGDFTGLKGKITFDPAALGSSSFIVTVNAATVDTDNGTRDKHLKKESYFHVEKYPVLSFVSTKVTKSTVAGRYYVFGNLTIKDVTKKIEFGFSATPTTTGYKFIGEFEINRRDFGVGGSSISMSDNLKITLEINANK